MTTAVTQAASTTRETHGNPCALTKRVGSLSLDHNSWEQPRTIAELIDIRAEELPSTPIISYPSKGIEYVDYTYADLQTYSKNAAGILSRCMTLRQASTESEKVVAILGPSDFDYLISILALSRLGYTVLFLSTRLSDAAYNALLKATNCSNIIYYPQFSKTVEAMKASRPDLNVLERLTMQQFSQLTTYQGGDFNLDEENDKISWIIHSSGSTGLPKPIYQTHNAALRNYENNMNMKGFITLPLFHAHGLSSVFRAVTSRKQIHMYNADLPLTQDTLLSIFQRHQFEIFYGVPYALKLLSETPDGVNALASLKVVMFGGSPCPDALGDLLVENGVNLISHYGTTETGQLMTSFRPAEDKVWNYVRVHNALQPYVRWEDRGGNLYELIVLDGWKSKVASNRDDGSYATKDLFEPHATIPRAWKFSGRSDDTIVLLNGEKAIPLATEQAVQQNPNVLDNVIFGSGKPQLGMIVISSALAKDLSEKEFINKIWPVVEKCNKDSPAYAQIGPEMIKVLPYDTKFPQTDKGTLIRQAFYNMFKGEIESVYEKQEPMSNGTLQLSEEELRTFVRDKLFVSVVVREPDSVTDETDFFSLGMDSLQAIRLRTAFKDLDLGGNTVSQNVVFENPSISQLARKLYCTRTGEEMATVRVEDEMRDLIERYAQLPAHIPVERANEGRHVVLTGATGSLGAHLIARLVKDPEVKMVHALVRAKDYTVARARVLRSLQDRLLLHGLNVSELRKIRALPSNFGEDKLGIDHVYDSLCDLVTDVIHCAWSVNFNKNLRSFEDDCIAGARNLMLLSLRARRPTPASFNFCSSVSAVAQTPGGFVPEKLPESLSYAQGMGYAQSKLVTENLVDRAAQSTGMKARVLRIGQISANTEHGIWNDTEAIPIMIQAAITIGALPALDEDPRWLPVDLVAQSVLDVSFSDSSQTVFNVVNPQTFHWTKDLLPALRSSGLQFEEVSQREWISRLRASDPDPAQNPPIKLLDFFASKYDNDVTHRPGLIYETTGAEALAPCLTTVGIPDSSRIQKFIRNICQTSWAGLVASKAIALPGVTFSTPQHRVLVIAGPCGVGKSTIAGLLSKTLQCPLVEGDSHHDEQSVAKMSSTQPLTAIDRAIWLARLKVAALKLVRDEGHRNVVLTCSALRKEYRDQLRDLAGDGSVQTHFVMLGEEESVLVERLRKREGHYMAAAMVRGQLDISEAVGNSEVDVLPEDASLMPELIVKDILGLLRL